VKELGRTNRKEKVLESVFKYWKRLLEMEESSLLGDALTYQREEDMWNKMRTINVGYGLYVEKRKGKR
jgi:hypothetical protein